MMRRTPLSLTITLGLLLGTYGTAEEPTPSSTPPATGPAAIQQQQPSFLVRADVDRANRSYREGDTLTVRVNCEVDAYLYVVYQQADGKAFQIFPNSGQPNNRVKAREAVQVPALNDRFRWQVGAPFGKEVVKVIASKQPIKQLSDEQMRAKRFNAISPERMKGIELEIGEEPPTEWAEDQVEITTYPRAAEQTASTARRFGVFLGVSEYMFNEQVRESSGGKHELNLSCCHRDARQLSDIMREVGRLDDLRMYTNDQATRAQFEQAVTKWLPSVSRPGDTVVIYFSGHGGQLPDDNGDEPDKNDEYLLPHDFLSASALVGLIEQEKKGKLDPRYASIVSAAKEIIARSGSPEKAIDIITRVTGVSDDLFGHWLQRLSGRQVIVILDICHSGGFATQEKSLVDTGSETFDFMDKEIGRLKDLGQPNTALFAASHTSQQSQEDRELGNGVMTYYLMNTVRQAPKALTLKDASEKCASAMHEYYEKLNEKRRAQGLDPLPGHEPVLYDYSLKPAMLKP